jgi:hypothetical protein
MTLLGGGRKGVPVLSISANRLSIHSCHSCSYFSSWGLVWPAAGPVQAEHHPHTHTGAHTHMMGVQQSRDIQLSATDVASTSQQRSFRLLGQDSISSTTPDWIWGSTPGPWCCAETLRPLASCMGTWWIVTGRTCRLGNCGHLGANHESKKNTPSWSAT